MMTSLRLDMDHADVGPIDETMIGEWNYAFGEIVRIHGKEMLSGGCVPKRTTPRHSRNTIALPLRTKSKST